MLVTLLRDEIATLTELVELLRQEYVYLQQRDELELVHIVGLKEDCAHRLQQLADDRVGYVLRHGFSVDAAGVEGFIDAVLGGCEQAKELWERLREMTVQAQRQNEINGVIITSGLSFIQNALTVLHGHEPDNCVYDQAARTDHSGYSRSLARA